MLILYYPGSNSFSSAGANAYPRLYHSVALLLPDATVWIAGSNPTRGTWESHMEIYQPAYLFTRDVNNNVVAATRPTISSAPGNIAWGGAVYGFYSGRGQYFPSRAGAAGCVYSRV